MDHQNPTAPAETPGLAPQHAGGVPSPEPVVVEQEPGLADCWRRLPDKGLFFGLLAAWLALFHFFGNSTFGYVDTPSLFHWMYNAYNSKSPTADDGHANLIPFVVLGLFWWKRQELLNQPLKTWWPALLLVALGLALHLVGYVIQQPRICVAGLFTGIYGLMGLAWGKHWLRASFFPFFLLGFMVPLGSLTEPITFPLRLMVSKLVAFVCHTVLGMDVLREGTRLFNGASLADPSKHFEYDVAAACSGIRSLMAITAIAIIYAFMVFRSWLCRGVLLASALPLAVLGNSFRLLVIVLAAESWGNEAGLKAHDSAFWSLLPYVPAIFGLMALGRWLERWEARRIAGATAKAA